METNLISFSIFLGRIDANNVATESENENTNPTPLDGDSNFVSNDSTSQEPIIDENTTQTTADMNGSSSAGSPMA